MIFAMLICNPYIGKWATPVRQLLRVILRLGLIRTQPLKLEFVGKEALFMS